MTSQESKKLLEYLLFSKKTLDTENNDIFIQELNHYGIRKVANNWFSLQYVCLNGFNSYVEHIR